RWKLEPASRRSSGRLCYGRGALRVACLRRRAGQRCRLSEGCAVVVAESTRRRFVVRANTRRAGSAAHVRELPERLASIRLGCCVMLGNDGITIDAAGQASLEQLTPWRRARLKLESRSPATCMRRTAHGAEDQERTERKPMTQITFGTTVGAVYDRAVLLKSTKNARS